MLIFKMYFISVQYLMTNCCMSSCCNLSDCDVQMLDCCLFASNPEGSLSSSYLVSVQWYRRTHAAHTVTQPATEKKKNIKSRVHFYFDDVLNVGHYHTHTQVFSRVRYKTLKGFFLCCTWIVLNWRESTDNNGWKLHRHGQCCGSMWRIPISPIGTITYPYYVRSAITWQQSCHWYDL